MYVVGIAIVKNEEDIIESFIRYNLEILDQLCIVDNGSVDGTTNIIEALIGEGYHVELMREPGEFNQFGIMNDMLKRLAAGEFGKPPDVIIPLDADEFLVAERGINPRVIIDDLDLDGIHLVHWLSFIPECAEPCYGFIPYCMMQCRDDEYEQVDKVILPCSMIKDGLVLVNGNHDVFSQNEIPKFRCNQLRIAHYPVRDQYQFATKCVLGYFNRLATKTYVKGRSRHIENAFYEIRNRKKPMIEFMREYARNYCLTYVPETAVHQRESLFQWIGEICLRYNDLRLNDYLRISLLDIEKIIERYRETFWKTEMCKQDDTEKVPRNSMDQYSYMKTRSERLKRDFYQCRSELLTAWIRCDRGGLDCDAILRKLIVRKTLIFGSFPSVEDFRHNGDVLVVETDASQYDVQYSIIKVLEKIAIPWNEIQKIIICDSTRSEELISFAKAHDVDRVVKLVDCLEEFRVNGAK